MLAAAAAAAASCSPCLQPKHWRWHARLADCITISEFQRLPCCSVYLPCCMCTRIALLFAMDCCALCFTQPPSQTAHSVWLGKLNACLFACRARCNTEQLELCLPQGHHVVHERVHGADGPNAVEHTCCKILLRRDTDEYLATLVYHKKSQQNGQTFHLAVALPSKCGLIYAMTSHHA